MQQPPEPVVALGFQLAVTASFVLLMTVMHSVGLLGIGKLLRLDADRLRKHDVDAGAIMLIAGLGLCIVLLHIAEIVVFAGYYLLVEGLDTVEEALFYSASAYATLGWTADYFPPEWRLIGALEALIGFVLIGWSTAFMVSTMQKLSETRRD